MRPCLLKRFAHVHVQKRRRVFASIILVSVLLYLYSSLITRHNETVDDGSSNDFKDVDFNIQHPALKIPDYLTGPLAFVYNGEKLRLIVCTLHAIRNSRRSGDVYQSKVNDTFKRHFILQEHELYLRTFAKPHTSRKDALSTVCDKEVLRAHAHTKKRIVFYNTPDWTVTGFNMSHCECSHCEIVYSKNITRADIVLFHGVRLSIRQPPQRPRGQIWVVVGSEAPIYYTGLLNTIQWKGVFNWTSTPRVDADIFHPYGMLVEKNGTPRSRTFYESLAKSKTKMAIAVISHCSTKSLRAEYIEELQHYMAVDVYGWCGIKTNCRKNNNTCYSELVQPYTFMLAFENALCEDYVTEKFFRAFNHDFPVIPVVRGGTDYHRYFPDGTFIDAADFNSPKDLARYLNNIGKDHKKVADMLEEKSRYRFVSMYHQCHICYLLHKYNISSSGIDPSVSAADRASLTKTYSDVFRWLLQDKCYPPQGFTRASKNL